MRLRRALKAAGLVVLALALVLGLSAAYTYRRFDGNLTPLDVDRAIVEPRLSDPETDEPRTPLNILVMGDDTRAGDNDIGDGEAGLGGSDTTILLHLSADRSRAYGISIPRDSQVTRPDCRDEDGEIVPGEADVDWNLAFAVAGPGCTVSQLEQTTGVHVHNTVVVDFAGFQAMVDAVDGVEVCLPTPIDDREHGIYLEAGTRRITGREALSYVRVRSNIGVEESDLARAKRQQAFLSSLAHQVVSADTLSHPTRLLRFLEAATSSLTTDLESVTQIARVGAQFRDIGLDEITFLTIPVEYTPDRNDVLWTPAAREVWQRIDNDEPLTRAQLKGATTAGTRTDGSDTTGDEAEARRRAGLCA
jgi:LCP family protein required for cell wall assembly